MGLPKPPLRVAAIDAVLVMVATAVIMMVQAAGSGVSYASLFSLDTFWQFIIGVSVLAALSSFEGTKKQNTSGMVLYPLLRDRWTLVLTPIGSAAIGAVVALLYHRSLIATAPLGLQISPIIAIVNWRWTGLRKRRPSRRFEKNR